MRRARFTPRQSSEGSGVGSMLWRGRESSIVFALGVTPTRSASKTSQKFGHITVVRPDTGRCSNRHRKSRERHTLIDGGLGGKRSEPSRIGRTKIGRRRQRRGRNPKQLAISASKGARPIAGKFAQAFASGSLCATGSVALLAAEAPPLI